MARDFTEELKKVPTDPGVYIMKNNLGNIIYVGKAKNLRNRLRQYFRDTITNRKVQAMVENIYEFEYIIVDTEVESLILEQNLIKKYMPKYNILLKDDKQFPYIKINIKDRFPKIIKTRSPRDDGSLYFGPFTNAISVNESIEFFSKYYKLRTCGLNLNRPSDKYKVCLNYHINLCSGPCENLIDHDSYMEGVLNIRRFLEGKDKSILKDLDNMMKQEAANLNFEQATYYRNMIEHLNNLLTKQSVDTLSFIDKDIIAVAKGEEDAIIQIFFVRGGKVLGRENYLLNASLDEEKKDVLSQFIKQYYAGYSNLPNEIFIEEMVDDIDAITEYISNLKGREVRIQVPYYIEDKELMKLAKKNAMELLRKQLEKFSVKNKTNRENLENLKEMLNLEVIPKRIEAYDISHYAGDQSVGSMVVYEDGISKKSDYRKFKIRDYKNDDYNSLREVLTRRFNRLVLEENSGKESFSIKPDLILMDGGKGQVNVATEVLDEMGLDIPIAGMIKDDNHTLRGIIYENVEYEMPINTNLFRMIFGISEETHRFAITFSRSRMSNRFYKSELDEIDGIGPTRKKNLIEHFKSIDRIRIATIDELKEVKGMNSRAAEAVYTHFREE